MSGIGNARSCSGSHPCVLANVFLMLHERGELSKISHSLLDHLQRPDTTGCPLPSPFYASRHFAELLASLRGDYDRYLHSTSNALFRSIPACSCTQNAEILIALERLHTRVLTDDQQMAEAVA